MIILIVDDSKAMRMILMRTLKQTELSSSKFIEAGNGEEAYRLIQEHHPDLVLCDWNMPVMSGLELLKKLRQDTKLKLFGFVTSECGVATRDLALASGAAFIVTKPFTVQAFETALRPFLSFV